MQRFRGEMRSFEYSLFPDACELSAAGTRAQEGSMAIGTEEMVLTDEQIERIAERAADIVAERQRKAARLFNADVRERGFEAVMVEGIQALRAEADRSEAR